MLDRHNLRDDQKFIVETMLREPAKLIVLKMGGGKTAAALTAARHLLDMFEVNRVLVIAPKRVAKDTWPTEVANWRHTRALSVAVIAGAADTVAKKKARDAAAGGNAEITIVNRESLVWLAKFHGTPSKWPYDMVIVDESSMFKAGKQRTKRTKYKNSKGQTVVRKGGKVTRFGVLAKVRKYIKRIYLLTGTAAPNGVIDLWGQAYLLDQGKRLGETQGKFHEKWFDKNQYSHAITPKDGAEDEIMGRISDIMVTLDSPKVVPDPVYIPIRVPLSRPVLRQFGEFKRTLVSEIHDVEAVTQGVLTNKLLQFANGSMYREDGSVAEVHSEKLDALDELIERAAGESVLVFYGFKFDLEAIRKRHPDAVVLNESETAVQDWNAGKIRILLAHPASCAHGLNLQYGGHIAIWYGLTWSLELFQQANARLPRPGQKHLVAIYFIIADGTTDERVLDVLQEKGVTQDRITNRVMRALTSD